MKCSMNILLCAALVVCLVQPTATKNSGKPVMSIAAIGDSFTVGWAPTAQTITPYTDTLRPCLQKATQDRLRVVTKNIGVSWAGVMMKNQSRNLTRIAWNFLDSVEASGATYNWAVLWTGGVNDIINARVNDPFPFDLVVGKYQAIWERCLRLGMKVVVMPQVSFVFTRNKASKHEKARQKLVAMIRKRVEGATRSDLKYFDLEAKGLNGWLMTQAQLSVYFNRLLHFKAAGYQKVGELLCNFFGPYARRVATLGNNGVPLPTPNKPGSKPLVRKSPTTPKRPPVVLKPSPKRAPVKVSPKPPAARRPPVQKSPVRKPPVRMPPVKKPAVKKPVVKKPPVKKPVVKKPAVKKPASKTPVRKSPPKKVTVKVTMRSPPRSG